MEMQLDDFDIGQLLGRGGFGSVFQAQLRDSHDAPVALKIMEKQRIQTNGLLLRVRNEIDTHQRLQHPSIVKLMGCFEDAHHVFIMLELCRYGNFFQYLKRHGAVSENQACFVMLQLLQGLEYLHRHGIVHRDLKLSNVLIYDCIQSNHSSSLNNNNSNCNNNNNNNNNNGEVMHVIKLCDFGLAVEQSHPDEEHYTICGTPNYIAPEIAKREAHGKPVDVWASGCLLYSLLCGVLPFDPRPLGASDALLLEATLSRIVSGNFARPSHVSATTTDFLDQLLEPNPLKRSTAHDMLQHPFFQQYKQQQQQQQQQGRQQGRQSNLFVDDTALTDSSQASQPTTPIKTTTTTTAKTMTKTMKSLSNNNNNNNNSNNVSPVTDSESVNDEDAEADNNNKSDVDIHFLLNNNNNNSSDNEGTERDSATNRSSINNSFHNNNDNNNNNSFLLRQQQQKQQQQHSLPSPVFSSPPRQYQQQQQQQHHYQQQLVNESWQSQLSGLRRSLNDPINNNNNNNNNSNNNKTHSLGISYPDLSSSSTAAKLNLTTTTATTTTTTRESQSSSLLEKSVLQSWVETARHIGSFSHCNNNSIFSKPIKQPGQQQQGQQELLYLSTELLLLLENGDVLLLTCLPDKHGTLRYCRVCIQQQQPTVVLLGTMTEEMVREVSLLLQQRHLNNTNNKKNNVDSNNNTSVESELRASWMTTPPVDFNNNSNNSNNSNNNNSKSSFTALNNSAIDMSTIQHLLGNNKRSNSNSNSNNSSNSQWFRQYSLLLLPRSLERVYRRVSRIIATVRSLCPASILYVFPSTTTTVATTAATATKQSSSSSSSSLLLKGVACKVVVMMNEPLPDVCVQWLSGAKLRYSLYSGRVSIHYPCNSSNNKNNNNKDGSCGDDEVKMAMWEGQLSLPLNHQQQQQQQQPVSISHVPDAVAEYIQVAQRGLDFCLSQQRKEYFNNNNNNSNSKTMLYKGNRRKPTIMCQRYEDILD